MNEVSYPRKIDPSGIVYPALSHEHTLGSTIHLFLPSGDDDFFNFTILIGISPFLAEEETFDLDLELELLLSSVVTAKTIPSISS